MELLRELLNLNNRYYGTRDRQTYSDMERSIRESLMAMEESFARLAGIELLSIGIDITDTENDRK